MIAVLPIFSKQKVLKKKEKNTLTRRISHDLQKKQFDWVETVEFFSGLDCAFG